MISDKELLQAITECENSEGNYTNCEKLATFYTIYDHRNPAHKTTQREELLVQVDDTTEIGQTINGMESGKAWEHVIDLIKAVQVLNPKLYRNFIEKLTE